MKFPGGRGGGGGRRRRRRDVGRVLRGASEGVEGESGGAKIGTGIKRKNIWKRLFQTPTEIPLGLTVDDGRLVSIRYVSESCSIKTAACFGGHESVDHE